MRGSGGATPGDEVGVRATEVGAEPKRRSGFSADVDTADLAAGGAVGDGNWGPDGHDYGDESVPPHVGISWTREDLCTGRDPDMEEALRLAEASAAG